MTHSEFLHDLAAFFRSADGGSGYSLFSEMVVAETLDEIAYLLDEPKSGFSVALLQTKGPLPKESSPVRIPIFDVATGKTYGEASHQ